MFVATETQRFLSPFITRRLLLLVRSHIYCHGRLRGVCYLINVDDLPRIIDRGAIDFNRFVQVEVGRVSQYSLY